MKSNIQKLTTLLILLIAFSACSVDAEKIEYGKDQCAYCSMNIVDKAHSAQYVTNKGKQFKFDAVECLVNDLKGKDENEIAIILVADYGNPGSMTEATKASYLISEQIKSPMGANLSAFLAKQKASELQKEFTGAIFNWEELNEKFQSN